jgi:hypothetical protein
MVAAPTKQAALLHTVSVAQAAVAGVLLVVHLVVALVAQQAQLFLARQSQA